MIRIKNANFIISAPTLSQSPDFSISEAVFLGRSNVGKSSLINSLTDKKNLAKSSSTPGKTQLINFFNVEFEISTDDKIFSTICAKGDEPCSIKINFVDLPGFGYAKVSKNMKSTWEKNLDYFLKNRTNIKLFIHLIDSRHFDLKIDSYLNDYINSFIRPDQKMIKIFTKVDKINQSQKSSLLRQHSNSLCVSTIKKSGLNEVKEAILKGVLGL